MSSAIVRLVTEISVVSRPSGTKWPAGAEERDVPPTPRNLLPPPLLHQYPPDRGMAKTEAAGGMSGYLGAITAKAIDFASGI